MSQSKPDTRLRSAGLPPTPRGQTVLDLMQTSDGNPLRCEGPYRLAMAAERSLNVSSIAHALSDLERAGLLVRVAMKNERRLFYQPPVHTKQVRALIAQTDQKGARELVDDPQFARQIHQWLSDRGGGRPLNQSGC